MIKKTKQNIKLLKIIEDLKNKYPNQEIKEEYIYFYLKKNNLIEISFLHIIKKIDLIKKELIKIK